MVACLSFLVSIRKAPLINILLIIVYQKGENNVGLEKNKNHGKKITSLNTDIIVLNNN